jgi:two-component system, NarL family, sensor histidine kinase DesK
MISGSASEPASPSWRTSDWWYLGFLIMLVFQPMFDPGAGVREWLLTAGVVLVFVPLYVLVGARPGPLRRGSPQLATLLGLATFPFNGGASVLLVYASAFAAAYRSRRVAVRWFAGLSAVTLALGLARG